MSSDVRSCDLGVRSVNAAWHDGLNSDLFVGSEHVVSIKGREHKSERDG